MQSSKSYDTFVLGLYEAILLDIADKVPELRKDCGRDYNRLLSVAEHQGNPFFWASLVAFGKHFDKCLSNGRLTKSELPNFRSFRRGGVIPKLFKGLLLRVFDESGALRSDADLFSITAIRQLCYAVKSWKVDCPDSSKRKQVHEFFATDGEIISPTLNWASYDLDYSDYRHLHFGDECRRARSEPSSPSWNWVRSLSSPIHLFERLCNRLQFVADALSDELGEYQPTEWMAQHGPGAVSDRKDAVWKYELPNWTARLDKVFHWDEFAFANYDHWIDAVDITPLNGEFSPEVPSKMIAVPKTYRGPRLIASEPTAHQWCQQSIRKFMMEKVKHTFLRSCISFRDQSPNQVLALSSSFTKSHATIDLSAASDRISCWAIERLFRRSPSLLHAIYASRTRWIRQDIEKKLPSMITLNKCFTMGSAITFPTQTLLFAAVAVACVSEKRGDPWRYRTLRKTAKEVRIFGDDIIVPTDCLDYVLEMLSYLGLKVNHEKTHSEGNFRESCGCDAFKGHDVTPVGVHAAPVKSKPEHVLSCVDAHNNLLKKGWWGTAAYVRKTVEGIRSYKFPEVAACSGSLGWHTDPLWIDLSGLKTRWNKSLQRLEYRVTRPKSQSDKVVPESNATLLQFFTERSAKISEFDTLGYQASRPSTKLRWKWDPLT